MGGAQARRLCPRRDRGPAADVARTRRRARPSIGCSTTRRRSSRACRSTRRSSTSAGCGGSRARRPRSPRGCGARCASGSGLPITVGVASTKFLAKVASGVAKPDGLLVVPPDGELAFLHPLPVERLWGVGQVTARQAPRARDHDGRPGRRLPEATLVSLLGRASGRHLHALAHNRDPRPVQVRPAPALDRRRSAPSVARRSRSPRSTRRSSALVDRVTRRHAGGRPSRPHGRASTALRRLLAGDPLAHAAARDREHADDPRHGEGAARRRCADDRAAWHHAGRDRGQQPRRRPRGPARCCRSTVTAAMRSTPRSTRCADASDRRRSSEPCSSAGSRASACRCSRTRHLQSEHMFAFMSGVQLALDSLDRLVDTLEERGPLSASDAARAALRHVVDLRRARLLAAGGGDGGRQPDRLCGRDRLPRWPAPSPTRCSRRPSSSSSTSKPPASRRRATASASSARFAYGRSSRSTRFSRS